MDPRLHALLKDLIRSTHTAVLSEPLEEKMIVDLAMQLEQRFADAILRSLSSDDRMSYQDLLQRHIPDHEMNLFLTEHIPDFPEIMKQTVQKFEDEYRHCIQAMK